MTSFDNEKMAGRAGVGTQVGEERQWSYQIVFGESLKSQIRYWGHKLPLWRVLNNKVITGYICATSMHSFSLTVQATDRSFGNGGFV